MKAKLTILFEQEKLVEEYGSGGMFFPAQRVYVCLRQWESKSCYELVLESGAVLDGDKLFQTYKVLHTGQGDAIRLAIKTFDDALAAHPVLGKAEKEAA